MAFASNVDLVRVKGEYVDFQGAAIAGQVTFRVPSTIQNASGDQILVPSTYAADLDANGQFGISLPITNDADFNSTFQYTVLESFSGGQSFSLSLPARRNLVSNPCFRVGTDGWSVLGAGTTFSRITTDSFATGSCLEITKGTTGNRGAFIDVPVTAGLVYTLSFYAKVPTGQESAPVQAYIDWRNAGYLSTTASTATTITAASGWTRLTITGTAPATATIARCYALVGSGTSGQKFLVDAVQVEQAATVGSYMVNGGTPRTNLIPNPSFETNTTGWEGNNGGTIARRTAASSSGSASCLVTQVASLYSGMILSFPPGAAVTAGRAYTISVYLRGVTASQSLLIAVHQLDSSNNIVTQAGTGTFTLSSGSGWVRQSFTFTAAAGVVSVRPMVIHPSMATAGNQFYVDGWLIEESAYLGDYMDGSLANTEWSGTAHASTSRTFYPMAEIRPASTGVEYVGMAPYGSYLSANTRVTAQEALLPTLPSLATMTDYATARLNLIPNPSFEANTTGWGAVTGNCTVTRSTGDSFTGGACAALSFNTSSVLGDGIQSLVPRVAVTAGLSYTFSAYLKVDSGATYSYDVVIAWLNIGGTDISYSATSANVAAGAGWTRLSATGTAPASAVSARYVVRRLTGMGTASALKLDAVMFEQSSSVGSYFDGSTGVWTGTANASTSRNYSAPTFQILAEAGRDLTLALEARDPHPFVFTGAG